MGRLPKRLTDNLPDLPDDLLRYLKRTGKLEYINEKLKDGDLEPLVEEVKTWKRLQKIG